MSTMTAICPTCGYQHDTDAKGFKKLHAAWAAALPPAPQPVGLEQKMEGTAIRQRLKNIVDGAESRIEYWKELHELDRELIERLTAEMDEACKTALENANLYFNAKQVEIPALNRELATLQQQVEALTKERDEYGKAINEANWILSMLVDAGGGTKALLKWAQMSADWSKVSCHRDQRDEARASLSTAQKEIERLTLNGLHTCHAECQRPLCVMGRALDAATRQNEGLKAQLLLERKTEWDHQTKLREVSPDSRYRETTASPGIDSGGKDFCPARVNPLPASGLVESNLGIEHGVLGRALGRDIGRMPLNRDVEGPGVILAHASGDANPESPVRIHGIHSAKEIHLNDNVGGVQLPTDHKIP